MDILTINGRIDLPLFDWNLLSYDNEPFPSLLTKMLKDKQFEQLVLIEVNKKQVLWILKQLSGNTNIKKLILKDINLDTDAMNYLTINLGMCRIDEIFAKNYTTSEDESDNLLKILCMGNRLLNKPIIFKDIQ